MVANADYLTIQSDDGTYEVYGMEEKLASKSTHVQRAKNPSPASTVPMGRNFGARSGGTLILVGRIHLKIDSPQTAKCPFGSHSPEICMSCSPPS